MITTIVAVLICMIIVPFCSGLLVTKLLPENSRTYGMVFTNGYMLSVVLFECIYLLFVFLKSNSVQWLGIAFAVCISVYAVLSALLGRECISDCEKNRKKNKVNVFQILFLILVLIQLVMRLLQQVSDGDDAFFVAGANVAAQSGQMNTILVYTGEYSLNPDMRHILSGLPVWIAVLSRFTGLPAAIMSHCVLGIIVLIMHYAILHVISGMLFPQKEEPKWLFLMLSAVFNIFGNISLYTPQTFLLTRTWQGKTMLANLAIPFAFLLILELYRCQKIKEKIAITGLLIMVYVFAGTCATTGFVIMLLLLPVFAAGFLRIGKKTAKEEKATHV